MIITPWQKYKFEKSENKFTAFKLHNGGLFNQIISLEIAMGIKYLLNSEMVIHNVIPLSSHSYSWENKQIYIYDLIENIDVLFNNNFIKNNYEYQTVIPSLMNRYIAVNNESDDFFAEGREQLIFDSNKFYYIKNTLSYYSIMFCNRNNQIDTFIQNVKFKKEYIELANIISKSLGDFVGLHVRLTDFSNQIYSIKEEEISHAYLLLLDNNLPIVLATDDCKSKKIKLINNKCINLENYIKTNFLKDFKNLPIVNDIVFDLIVLLVLINSKNFIGTIGSTYSGYIHRAVNQSKNGNHQFYNMGDFQNTNGTPYSWNSYDKIPIGKKLWWREWKESFYV